MKRFSIVTIVLLVAPIATLAHIELILSCSVGDNLVNTKEIKYFAIFGTDTLLRNGRNDFTLKTGLYDKTTIGLPGKYKVVFNHLTNGEWTTVEYDFVVDGKEKAVQVFLYYTDTSAKLEYLRDLTISKFYTTRNVSLIDAWDKKIGSRPLYKIKNNSDSTFFGVSLSNHFYGKMLYKDGDVWSVSSGSYCGSTLDADPLVKGSLAFSHVPAFSESRVFRIQQPGEYRYVVLLALKKYSDDIPSDFIRTGTTRKRTLTYFELEDHFSIL